MQAVLDTLKLTGARWQTHRADCPTGGTLWTIEADVSSAPPSLVDSLKPGSDAIVARKDLVAYRSGPAGVVARSQNGGLTITSTTGC